MNKVMAVINCNYKILKISQMKSMIYKPKLNLIDQIAEQKPPLLEGKKKLLEEILIFVKPRASLG
jgi:hypothetical protein